MNFIKHNHRPAKNICAAFICTEGLDREWSQTISIITHIYYRHNGDVSHLLFKFVFIFEAVNVSFRRRILRAHELSSMVIFCNAI